MIDYRTAQEFLPGFQLIQGERRDKPLLLKFLQQTYQELFPEQQDFSHLIQTVDQYFSSRSRLWLVTLQSSPLEPLDADAAIAALWLGNAINQVTGKRYTHIFMLYVLPPYRRQGIAKALLKTAQQWAQQRGDQQIGLQVFSHNQAALNLYKQMNFQTQAVLLFKPLSSHHQADD
jgi:ribosomal protein S18 acetylase RimI-like enzyme